MTPVHLVWNRDGQNPESESNWSRSMAFFVGFGVGVGVCFLLICRSRSGVGVSYQIIKSKPKMMLVFRSRTGVGVEFVRVGVESESEIRDSAHLWFGIEVCGVCFFPFLFCSSVSQIDSWSCYHSWL